MSLDVTDTAVNNTADTVFKDMVVTNDGHIYVLGTWTSQAFTANYATGERNVIVTYNTDLEVMSHIMFHLTSVNKTNIDNTVNIHLHYLYNIMYGSGFYTTTPAPVNTEDTALTKAYWWGYDLDTVTFKWIKSWCPPTAAEDPLTATFFQTTCKAISSSVDPLTSWRMYVVVELNSYTLDSDGLTATSTTTTFGAEFSTAILIINTLDGSVLGQRVLWGGSSAGDEEALVALRTYTKASINPTWIEVSYSGWIHILMTSDGLLKAPPAGKLVNGILPDFAQDENAVKFNAFLMKTDMEVFDSSCFYSFKEIEPVVAAADELPTLTQTILSTGLMAFPLLEHMIKIFPTDVVPASGLTMQVDTGGRGDFICHAYLTAMGV